jgi:biopolymer transport protein TolR
MPVRVVVRSDGRVSIIEKDKGETPVPAGQLIASVRSRQKEPRTPVVIEADSKVQYKSVVDVMRELQKAGVERVGLSVQLAQ